MFCLIIILLAQIADYGSTGPYSNVSYRVVNIPGTYENMNNSRIYYPSQGNTVDPAAVPCPIIVFGHGFQMGIDRYYSYATHLASWGYVVVLPTISNPTLTPEHYTRARSMVDAARYVASLNNNPNDIFYGKLDATNWGFAGHSMGGGLALLAADTFRLRDTLRAVVSLASPQTTPPTHPQHLQVPKMILAGSVDNIAPWNDVKSAYWVNSPEPGVFAVINGANHGQFMDYSYFWENGGTATINRETQLKIARRHMTAFFNRYLKNEETDWNFQYTYGDSINGHPTMYLVEVNYNPSGIDSRKTFPERKVIIGSKLKITERKGTAYVYDITGNLIEILETPAEWEPGTSLRRNLFIIKIKQEVIHFIRI
ncbi:MAG: alpha/beta hydrolase [candidate division WOR-3 bacterium]